MYYCPWYKTTYQILKSGLFPKEWNYGPIRLIHKGLDVYDDNNYRRITCLGKTFYTIDLILPLKERTFTAKNKLGIEKMIELPTISFF